jgi:tetratricopeptide (TPR) repeat protein
VLQLPGRDDKDQQRVVAAVQHWLSTHGQWLLIWDNVEDLALLDRFLPAARSGASLITTRCQALGTFARGLDLLPMEHEEGMLFLLRRAKVLEPEATHEQVDQLAEQVPSQYTAAADLVTALGGLPLAIDQAGAYLEETQCGLPAYLELFHSRRATLLQQRGEGARGHPASVFTTFTLAITATAQRHPAVWDLLRVCALLQPDTIPEELFRQGGEHLGTTLEAVRHDELEWNRVIAVACSYSLLSRQPEAQTLSLHRLMQAVILDAMTQAEREQWEQQAIDLLEHVFPEVEYATWRECERLLPHVLLCLHRAGSAMKSPVLALLAFRAARYLRARGRYAEAEPLFQRALHIREQTSGPEHPDVALSLLYLAILYREQGKYAEAEPLFLRALYIWEQATGADHSDVATALNNLAILYWEQGRYIEAEPLFERALHIWEQAVGADHPQVAYTLNNLALLYKSQGKYVEAEPLFQRALFIQEQAMGADHPQVAFPLNNLAALYQEQGKYTEAELLFERALHIWEQAMGADHPDVARALNNLAAVYRTQNKYAEAEPLFERALHIWEQTLGGDHPLVAHTLEDLGALYKDRSQYVEAEPLFQRSLHIRELALGLEHPDTGRSLNNLAALYQEQGKYVEAEPLFLHALHIREQHLGQQHPKTAETLHELALFRQKQGNSHEAMLFAERALEILCQALGDTHPQTVATQALYDQLLREQACTQKEMASERGAEEISDPRSEESRTERLSPSLHETGDPSFSENDPLQAFLDACCELHPLAWCRISDLWQTYEQWTTSSRGRVPLSRRAFAAQLKALGCHTDRTNTARIWRGIRITLAKPDSEQK